MLCTCCLLFTVFFINAQELISFSDRQNHIYGFKDNTGKIAFSRQCDSIGYFNPLNGFSKVYVTGKVGLINYQGKYKINVKLGILIKGEGEARGTLGNY